MFQFTLNSWGPPSQCRPAADGDLEASGQAVSPPGLFTLTEKQPLSRASPCETDDSSEGPSAVSLTQGQRQWLRVSQKTRWTVSQRARGGKRRTAAAFGRVMSSLARQPGENIEGVACFLRIFLSLSLSRERGTVASPPQLPPPSPFHHLGLSPPCQQRCAIVSERPISIIQLMNTEWPQVVLIKKVQRLQTVCNLSPVGEGFYKKTGQRKKREGELE